MKKTLIDRLRRGVGLVCLLLLSTIAWSQSDTVWHFYRDALRTGDKLAISRLSLADIVVKKNSIPNGVRGFRNLTFLSLRPSPTRFARPRGGGPCILGYPQTKIAKLPSWISELEKLQNVNLIGITKMDYPVELLKLLKLPALKELSIDPDDVDENLLQCLSKFKKLQSLKVRAALNDEQLASLTNALPNCSIMTGTYADY